jgi:purine-cytosine permease-like protein
MDEFERQPVPADRLKSLRSFVNLYAGEHVAGTEFMIGPLFLAAGVSAFDLLVGLFVGNLLAVLSWTFVCAPIATSERRTLYAVLERICGRDLVRIYNIANGVLFCILAGAMVSVSATAVGVPFDMTMPGLDDVLPNSVGWIAAVLAIGALFAIVAARGYDAMARVANISVPWMALVFLACGIIALPLLGVTSLSDFWSIASQKIWKGGEPLGGQTKFTFWHVVFFAWFCNAAMHMGMADMSILRYARKWQHGAASGAGMFLGHYLAWISASLLYAVQLTADPSNIKVAPGPMAYGAVGVAGLVCVVIAGWTTANPTIYRAGLAFQSLFPRSSRYTVTLGAGAIATAGALFPGVAMRLLDFVGLYGTILMPMGAIIVTEHHLFGRFGLQRDYAIARGSAFNGAAGTAWIAALALCALLNIVGGVQVYFLALPGWCISGLVYLLLAYYRDRGSAVPVTRVREAGHD